MTVDPIWEEIHSSREWGKYPPEELVRFVARRYYGSENRKAVRILDLGCGLGSGVWYFCREGFSASGIDSSPSAIDRLERRLEAEGLTADLHVGDIVHSLPGFFHPESFDAITEVTCLYCLPFSEAKSVVRQAANLLKPGGCFFAMTFDVATWGFGLGRQVEPNSFADITEGPLKDRGFARFYARHELDDLFSALPIVSVESTTRTLQNERNVVKHWVVECQKP